MKQIHIVMHDTGGGYLIECLTNQLIYLINYV